MPFPLSKQQKWSRNIKYSQQKHTQVLFNSISFLESDSLLSTSNNVAAAAASPAAPVCVFFIFVVVLSRKIKENSCSIFSWLLQQKERKKKTTPQFAYESQRNEKFGRNKNKCVVSSRQTLRKLLTFAENYGTHSMGHESHRSVCNLLQ